MKLFRPFFRISTLKLIRKPCFIMELPGEALLIGGFQQSGSEMTMDFYGGAYYPVG